MGLIWGVLGVVALLSQAVVRLSPMAWEALSMPLTPVQWVALGVFVPFMAYSEGYKGFQKAFSPRVVARGLWLRANPRPLLVLLAPAFCMGLVHATRKRLTVSWIITIMVVLLIMGVRQVDQPWRGIVDAGVVVGLSWGLLAIAGWVMAALLGKDNPMPHDVPES